jgi:hypothetical protein
MAHRSGRQRKPDVTKKDRQGVQRDLRNEIAAEAPNNTVETTQRKPNRDAARGDWDRGHPRGDDGMSREPEPTEGAAGEGSSGAPSDFGRDGEREG